MSQPCDAAAPLTALDPVIGNDGRRGFRVPALLISPFARREHVARGVYDHTSVLRSIEARWGLQPLTVRDATANDLMQELDLDGHSVRAPVIPPPPAFVPAPCPAVANPLAPANVPAWAPLRDLARGYGWPV